MMQKASASENQEITMCTHKKNLQKGSEEKSERFTLAPYISCQITILPQKVAHTITPHVILWQCFLHIK